MLPELNQTPSLYNQGPVDITEPNDKSDPYETKFTAKTVNDTARIRGRRGFGSILAKARTNHPGNRECKFIHQG